MSEKLIDRPAPQSPSRRDMLKVGLGTGGALCRGGPAGADAGQLGAEGSEGFHPDRYPGQAAGHAGQSQLPRGIRYRHEAAGDEGRGVLPERGANVRISLLAGNFAGETGSIGTASSASQSGLQEPYISIRDRFAFARRASDPRYFDRGIRCPMVNLEASVADAQLGLDLVVMLAP